MSDISDEKLSEIQQELEGTCNSLSRMIERHELDIDEDSLVDRLLDGDTPIERSRCCEWWFAVSELEFDADRNGGVCQQCEPDAFD